MKGFFKYKMVTGTTAMLASILSAACLWVGTLAVEYNFDAFSDPALTLNYAHNSGMAYWFLIFDLFGYYLLLLPIIFYLHERFAFHSPWNRLFTFCGLAYVFTGAIGAALLAATWPQLMQDYLAAQGEQRQTVAVVFKAVTYMVTGGLWNILEVLFAGVWWIGVGKLLYREQKMIGIITIIAGVSCLLDGAGNIFGAGVLSDIGLNIYLVLGIVWPAIMAVMVWRKAVREPGYQNIKNDRTAQAA